MPNHVPRPLIAFTIAMAVYVGFYQGPTGAIEHVVQAIAFLQGHTYIDPIQIHEKVTARGHDYDLHPPLSAVILTPFVAIWGLRTNQTLVCIVIGALAVGLAYRLTESWWLTAFFAFGTPLAFAASDGLSWCFALVLSTVPTLLALREGFVTPRPRVMLMGLWAGIAGLARYDLILVWPVYLIVNQFSHCPSPDKPEDGRHNYRHFLLGLTPAILAYLAWNYARFETLTDGSLWLWWAHDSYRAPHAGSTTGPFSIHYLPWNLYSAFFMAPLFQPTFPWIRPWVMGESLLFTSPALLLALRAPWDRLTLLLWTAVGLSMAAALTVYANGMIQFGARYWIQALPFLLALMARSEIDRFARILIGASIILTLYGMWVVRNYGFMGPIV